jgi:GLPGLI family protein
MKKQIYSLSILLVIFFVLSLNVNAQKKVKPFKGYVKYEISYEGEIDAQQKQQMPKEQLVYMMGAKSKIVLKMPMGEQQILLDGENMEMTIVFSNNASGKGFAIKTEKEEVEKSLSEAPKVEIKVTQETKEIAGYTCKKAEVIQEVDGEEIISVIYYTEDINVDNPNWFTEHKDIKGVIFEYSQTSNDITSTYKAVVVKKGKVKDATFKIPVDYKILTEEEAAALFGGNSDVDDL